MKVQSTPARRASQAVILLLAILSGLFANLSGPFPAVAQASFAEDFDNPGPTDPGQDGPANLIAGGWIFRNQSQPEGPVSWYGSGSTQAFGPHTGTGFLSNHWESTMCGVGAKISNWAILPAIPNQAVGDVLSFFTNASIYYTRDDRVQVRYSASGGTNTGSGPEDVGDFTSVLLDINPVPKSAWTEQRVSLPGAGRIALRYYLPDAGWCNLYGGFFGIDTLVVGTPPQGTVPFPQPGQTVTWGRTLSPIVIQGRQIIASGGTVVVEPGVEIQVQTDSTLVVDGTLQGAGTAQDRIRITAPQVYPPAVEVFGTLDLAFADISGQVRPDTGGNLLFSQTIFQGNGTMFNPGISGNPAFVRIDSSQFNGADLYISDSTLLLTNTSFNGANSILNRGYLFAKNVQVDGGYFSVGRDYQPTYIDDLTVTNSPVAGLTVGGSQAGNDTFIGPNVVLQNNQFPVQIGNGGLLPGSFVPATGNWNNQVLWSGEYDQRGPATLADVGIPYRIDGAPGLLGLWKLLPGVDVLLAPQSYIFAKNGTLIARGLEGNPVTFRRLDPAQAWGRIYAPTRLEHVELEGSTLGIYAYYLTQVDSSILRNNEVAASGPVILRSTQFLNNVTGAIIGFPGDLNGRTNPNSFEGNTLAVQTAYDATYNWWGAACGPDVGNNCNGDPIAGGIPYQPFLTARPDYSDSPPVVNIKTAGLFEPGQKVVLSWDAQDDVGITSQRITFKTDSGLTTVAANLPGSQRSIEWVVPDIGLQVSNSTPLLRVTAVDTAGHEGWDELGAGIRTTDLPGTLTLTTDLTGPFKPGDSVNICWTASGLDINANGVTAYLVLENGRRSYSLGGVHTGLNCVPLGLGMPFVSTDSARVVLNLSSTLNSYKLFHSSPFTIRPDPRVGDTPPSVAISSPGAGTVFSPGSVIPIAWSASDNEAVRAFDVLASYDSGKSWNVIAENLPPATTSYNWQTAPGSGFADLRIRVVAHDLRFQDSSSSLAISTKGSVPPPPSSDTVAIQRAEYTKNRQQLRIEATSSSAAATLTVYVTSSGQLIGTLANRGNGRFSGQFSWPSNPANVTVRSSQGGTASSPVRTR